MSAKQISREEFSKHTSPSSLWLCIHGRVYDVTPYLTKHPGGFSYLYTSAGKDVSADFEAMFHSARAREIMKEFEIGVLEGASLSDLSKGTKPSLSALGSLAESAAVKQNKPENTEKKKKPLSKKTLKDFELIDISLLTKDTKVYRFKVPDGKRLSIPLGHHLVVAVDDAGTILKRQYTPIAIKKGSFDLLIKTYKTGNLSEYISYMNVGESLPMMGPFGEWQYIDGAYGSIKMFAAGTGVTPMYRIIDHIIREDELTSVSLLFANRTEKDVILKKKLDNWAEDCDRFKVFYLLSQPAKETNLKGRVSVDIVNQTVKPQPSDRNEFVLICGPDGFVDSVKEILKQLEYPMTRVHVF